MSKKTMTKERYLELKQMAKSILTKFGSETKLDEITCKNIIDKVNVLEDENEKIIMINSLMFPNDEEFLGKLKSCNKDVNAVAKFYNCSVTSITKKYSELAFYSHLLRNFSFIDKVDEVSVESVNNEKKPINGRDESIDDLRLKLFEYEKLLEQHEQTAKETKDRMYILEDENKLLKRTLQDTQDYLKNALGFLDNLSIGRK